MKAEEGYRLAKKKKKNKTTSDMPDKTDTQHYSNIKKLNQLCNRNTKIP